MYRCSECGTIYSWAHKPTCEKGKEWEEMKDEFFFGGLDYLRNGNVLRLANAGARHRALVPSAYEGETHE